MYLIYLLIIGNATYDTGPEPLWNEVSQPEPTQSRKIVLVSELQDVPQVIVGLRVGDCIRHQGGDEHLEWGTSDTKSLKHCTYMYMCRVNTHIS